MSGLEARQGWFLYVPLPGKVRRKKERDHWEPYNIIGVDPSSTQKGRRILKTPEICSV
jgi:hypothetical protein